MFSLLSCCREKDIESVALKNWYKTTSARSSPYMYTIQITYTDGETRSKNIGAENLKKSKYLSYLSDTDQKDVIEASNMDNRLNEMEEKAYTPHC